MPTARYKFSRDITSTRGLQSGSRASTDAISALIEWSEPVVSRSYDEVPLGEDETLVADLTWSEADLAAGENLDHCCRKFGVTRSHIDPV
jgi:hypothetical protein